MDPAGEWIAAVSKFGPLRVWDVRAGKLLHEFPSLSRAEPRRSVALSRDGQLLAHLGDDRVWLRRSRDWRVVWEFPRKASVVAFTPDGLLALGSSSGLEFLDPGSTNIVSVFEQFPTDIRSILSFSDDGKLFLVRKAEGATLLVERHTGKVLQRFPKELYASSAMSPDGRRIATGGQNGELTLWDAGTPPERVRVVPNPKAGYQNGYSAAGDWVCARLPDRMVFHRVPMGRFWGSGFCRRIAARIFRIGVGAMRRGWR